MRSSQLLLAFIAVVFACGCGKDATADEAATKSVTTHAAATHVLVPDVSARTSIALMHDGEKIRVGDDWDDARKVFVAPRGAYEVNDLPPGLSGSDYMARGWETNNDGFGAILYTGKIAMAMYRLERTQPDRLDEILATYRNTIGVPSDGVPPEVIQPGAHAQQDQHVRYWFWTDKGQRLMVSAVRAPDGLGLTVAMGDSNTMDALGMSPSAAKIDWAKAEKAFQASEGPAPK